MASWALAEAKAKLSEVVDRAEHHEPQEITRNGKPVAVIISREEWLRSKNPAPANQRSMLEFFRDSPLRGSGIDLRRQASKPRKVKL